MPKKEKSCGAVVWLNFGGKIKILVVNLITGGGHIWNYPKGHVIEGETEEQTALREIKEETNLKVKLDTRFIAKNTYKFKNLDGILIEKKVTYFAAEAKDSETIHQKEELKECRWCDFQEAENLITYESDKQILKKFIKFIEGVN